MDLCTVAEQRTCRQGTTEFGLLVPTSRRDSEMGSWVKQARLGTTWMQCRSHTPSAT